MFKLVDASESVFSTNRHKYYLEVHLVFVCKYRKPLLENSMIDQEIKKICAKAAESGDLHIDIMETDKNHIHLLISYPPLISVTPIVRKLKRESTIALWRKYSTVLNKHFWNEHTFWSDGYFACSIGEASPDTIRKYIVSQG